MEQADTPEIPEASDRRLNRAVAATVVIMSVAMAFTNIKDGNIVQNMQQDQSNRVDLWSEYQATRLKLHVEETAVAGYRLSDTPAATAAAAKAAKSIAKYERESKDLKKQATDAQTDYDANNYRDDQFDLSDGFSSIALAVTAIAALVESWGLLFFGWGAASFGLLFSIAGFARLPIHPDWIVGFLT